MLDSLTLLAAISFSFTLGLSCALMPCCLPMVPGFLAYSIKEGAERKQKMKAAATFAFGVLLPFAAVGVLFGLIGGIVASIAPWLIYAVALFILAWGALLVKGVEVAAPFRLRPKGAEGMKGALLNGSAWGIGTSDCAIMVAAPVYFLSLTIANVPTALFYFIFFGLGRSTPILLAGLLSEKGLQHFSRVMLKHGARMSKLAGSLAIIAGLWLLLAQLLLP